MSESLAVPMSYAEKAMNSLMKLHEELMTEKESRIELERQSAAQRQEVADLKLLVKVLEERLGDLSALTGAGRVTALQSEPVWPRIETPPSTQLYTHQLARGTFHPGEGRATAEGAATAASPPKPPTPPAAPGFDPDGWKTW